MRAPAGRAVLLLVGLMLMGGCGQSSSSSPSAALTPASEFKEAVVSDGAPLETLLWQVVDFDKPTSVDRVFEEMTSNGLVVGRVVDARAGAIRIFDEGGAGHTTVYLTVQPTLTAGKVTPRGDGTVVIEVAADGITAVTVTAAALPKRDWIFLTEDRITADPHTLEPLDPRGIEEDALWIAHPQAVLAETDDGGGLYPVRVPDSTLSDDLAKMSVAEASERLAALL